MRSARPQGGLPGGLLCSRTPSPWPRWGTLGQQSHPVRKRTQALNEFIHEKTQGNNLLVTSSRSSCRNSREDGPGHPRDRGLGELTAPWGQRSRLARPIPRTPVPLWVKVQLGGR